VKTWILLGIHTPIQRLIAKMMPLLASSTLGIHTPLTSLLELIHLLYSLIPCMDLAKEYQFLTPMDIHADILTEQADLNLFVITVTTILQLLA